MSTFCGIIEIFLCIRICQSPFQLGFITEVFYIISVCAVTEVIDALQPFETITCI